MSPRATSQQAKRQLRKPLFVLAALLLATALVGASARRDGPAPPPLDTPHTGKPPIAVLDGGPVAMRVGFDRTRVQTGGEGIVRMELVIEGKDRTITSNGLATDLVIVLDRSGSMSGPKIEQARQAIHRIIDQLTPEDRFSLVSFSNRARRDIQLGYATPAHRARWHAQVGAISSGGGTNMTEGLGVAMDMVETIHQSGRAPRAILLSDGQANDPNSARETFQRRARGPANGEFILSTIGIGEGFDELLMMQLADLGTGNTYYLQNMERLQEILHAELDTSRETVASAVAVQIQTGTGIRVLDAAGYPLESSASLTTFRPGSLFAGQERRIWVTLQIPNTEAGTHALPGIAVEFNVDGERRRLHHRDLPAITVVESEKEYLAGIDPEDWARSVVVEEYNQVREQVADLVRKGKKKEAKRTVATYRARNERMNESIASAPVAASLQDAADLEKEIDEMEESQLKALGYAGQESRRLGSKK